VAVATLGVSSPLPKKLALILASMVGWLGLGLCSANTGKSSNLPRFGPKNSAAVHSSRTHEIKSLTQRHPSAIHGLFDDDSALVCDETESGVEVCASLALGDQAVLGEKPVPIPPRPHRMIGRDFSTTTAPTQRLCRYQC
jgi:hypothetical protein